MFCCRVVDELAGAAVDRGYPVLTSEVWVAIAMGNNCCCCASGRSQPDIMTYSCGPKSGKNGTYTTNNTVARYIISFILFAVFFLHYKLNTGYLTIILIESNSIFALRKCTYYAKASLIDGFWNVPNQNYLRAISLFIYQLFLFIFSKLFS